LFIENTNAQIVEYSQDINDLTFKISINKSIQPQI